MCSCTPETPPLAPAPIEAAGRASAEHEVAARAQHPQPARFACIMWQIVRWAIGPGHTAQLMLEMGRLFTIDLGTQPTLLYGCFVFKSCTQTQRPLTRHCRTTTRRLPDTAAPARAACVLG